MTRTRAHAYFAETSPRRHPVAAAVPCILRLARDLRVLWVGAEACFLLFLPCINRAPSVASHGELLVYGIVQVSPL